MNRGDLVKALIAKGRVDVSVVENDTGIAVEYRADDGNWQRYGVRPDAAQPYDILAKWAGVA